MNTQGILYAVITVLAWGAWLTPSQNVPMKSQQTRTLYVTIAVMLMALVVSMFVGFDGLNPVTFWFPFIGGLIWALSGLSSFIGTRNLGMAKAFGIWAPMNIIISIIWGIVLFGEFLDFNLSKTLLAAAALLVIIGGILLIIFADAKSEDPARTKAQKMTGLLGAMGAGVGFASYFIPIQLGTANYPEFNMWIGTLPMSIGMVVGSVFLLILSKSSPKLEKPGHYFRVLSTGALWAVGNYAALLMMQEIGTGRGFTIAQLCVVVNALLGIYILKDPNPKSKAAKITLAGIILAIIGATVLGNL